MTLQVTNRSASYTALFNKLWLAHVIHYKPWNADTLSSPLSQGQR